MQFPYLSVKITDSKYHSSLSIRCKMSIHNSYVAFLLRMWWHSTSTVLMAINAIVVLTTGTLLCEECVSIDACCVDLRRIRAQICHFCLPPLQHLSVFYLQHTKHVVLQKSLCHSWIDGLRAGNIMIFRTKISRYACSRLKFIWTKIQAEPSVPVNFSAMFSTLKGTSDSSMRLWQLQVFTFLSAV